jgi:uncharacterized membrane protein YeiH
MLYILDLLGAAIFAITGAITAGRKRMDVFGIIVVGTVTALGGGTTRDLILGVKPVFWVSDPTYVIVSMSAGLGTFIYAHYARPPSKTLLFADAFGLAIFTVIGCQRAAKVEDSILIVVVMGIMTGVTGGMIRDVLCGEIPLILRREIYATASLTGGLMFVILRHAGLHDWLVIMLSVMTALAVRLVSLHWHLSLPIFIESNKRQDP